MFPSFLITFREVLEASLIIATILGILAKIGHTKSIKTVWLATASAFFVCLCILGCASLLGIQAQHLLIGKTEAIVEGIFMMLSAVFITWAVFFLHTYFAHDKVKLLQKVKKTLELEEQEGIFMLVFSAIFREGFEIIIFLSTIYFSSTPLRIFSGFGLGLAVGLFVAALLFSATIRLPVYYAFRATSMLLILFAAGLLARGFGEFIEIGAFSFTEHLPQISFFFLPADSTFTGGAIKTIFGITHSMNTAQLILYCAYICSMVWQIFRKKTINRTEE